MNKTDRMLSKINKTNSICIVITLGFMIYIIDKFSLIALNHVKKYVTFSSYLLYDIGCR